MQWLAEICVKRPVFAWVLVLSLSVVGLFAFGQLGVDRFPNVDIPTISVTTPAAGRGARADRDRGHRQDRGVGQHHQRHRHAHLDLVRGHLPGGGVVQAREERRHRRAGSARPHQPGDAAAAAHGAAADRRKARLQRGAGHHDCCDRRQAGPRHHRVRRQGPAAPSGKLRRRRPGRGDWRPQPPVEPVAQHGVAARAEAVGERRRPRPAAAERRHPRRPHGPGRAVGDPADPGPARIGRRVRRRGLA